jgi:molybdate transport system substrate-binding protein
MATGVPAAAQNLVFCCDRSTSSIANMTASSIRLDAAGRLKAALTDVVAAFEFANEFRVAAYFDPSGLLPADIAGGAPADVFASASMRCPQALHEAGASGRVCHFAPRRNSLADFILSPDGQKILAGFGFAAGN